MAALLEKKVEHANISLLFARCSHTSNTQPMAAASGSVFRSPSFHSHPSGTRRIIKTLRERNRATDCACEPLLPFVGWFYSDRRFQVERIHVALASRLSVQLVLCALAGCENKTPKTPMKRGKHQDENRNIA